MNSAFSTAAEQGGKIQTFVVGGGCFWCTEAVFERVPGVKSVVSGYSGGDVPNPTYEQVCTGETGYAEVSKLEFDPAVVSADKLLEVFFEAHDPTTLNRQGMDEGTQYRSVIFYADEAQHEAAIRAKKTAQKNYADPIVTQIEPLKKKFYPAENYLQDYFKNYPNANYCQSVICPKLSKLERRGVISSEK